MSPLCRIVERVVLTRIVALVVALVVAGVSSSFALCVSGCAKDAPAVAHTCHEQSGGLKVRAGTGACPHAPVIGAQADLVREPRVIAAGVAIHHDADRVSRPLTTLMPSRVVTSSVRLRVSSPILRI